MSTLIVVHLFEYLCKMYIIFTGVTPQILKFEVRIQFRLLQNS